MKKIPTRSPVDQMKSWFEKVHPDPSDRDIRNQAANYLTSTTAFLLACQEVASTSASREELGFSVNVIDFIQRRIKASSEGIDLNVTDLDRVMMLTALCAQIRACIGIAHMLEMDVGGALQELAESDLTKLDPDGRPVFNDKNLLSDGQSYRRPDYMQFV